MGTAWNQSLRQLHLACLGTHSRLVVVSAKRYAVVADGRSHILNVHNRCTTYFTLVDIIFFMHNHIISPISRQGIL
jgi:hypothetical protein